MADKAVSELIAAEQITATDLFVLEQNGTAKKLTGQILLNWLTRAADGHGGISGIAKKSTSGLADTYRITLADTTTFDFVVTNGKGITKVAKTSTSGLVDTYTITYNDGTTGTFTVTNGARGATGAASYVWIKYASQQPTASSHSFGDVPDAWIGIYSGTASSAPTDWQQYKWFRMKGDTGDTGAAATLVSSAVEYQVGDYGNVVPSGAWSKTIPSVSAGKFLWTRITNTFNSGSPVVAYSVARFGIDGSGSVASVNGTSPDSNGNVALTPEILGTLSINGGTLGGNLNVHGILNGDIPLEIGQYLDFHSGAGDVNDFMGRLYVNPSTGALVYQNTVNANKSGDVFTAGSVMTFYSASVNFTDGKATFENSNIDASDVAIVQRRSATVGTAQAFATTSNDGSLTICGASNLNGAVSVNIIIFKTK